MRFRLRRLPRSLANASLRVRIMVAAAILVMVTSAVMGLLGTTLLRGYLMNRIDTQLRTLSSALAQVSPHPPPARFRHKPPGQPASFFMEIIDANGRVHVTPESVRGIPRPGLPPRSCTVQPARSPPPPRAPPGTRGAWW